MIEQHNKETESQRAKGKEDITTSEYPEGGGPICTKDPPESPRGESSA